MAENLDKLLKKRGACFSEEYFLEVEMPRKLVIALCALFVLFAFTACPQTSVIPFPFPDPTPDVPTPGPDPSDPSDPNTVPAGSDLSGNVSPDQPTTMLLEEGEYRITSAVTMQSGSKIVGKEGSVINAQEEITAGTADDNTPVILQKVNIKFENSDANTRVIDAFSPLSYEGGSVTASGTTIAIALNNSTSGSVIKDVSFSGMTCAVNISTPDFTLENCTAEEGSKFYMDVLYVDGLSHFINCSGRLEIYEPTTTSDESEQKEIINKIKATSSSLDVEFVTE